MLFFILNRVTEETFYSITYEIVAIERKIQCKILHSRHVKVKRVVMLFLYLKTKNAHWILSAVISNGL